MRLVYAVVVVLLVLVVALGGLVHAKNQEIGEIRSIFGLSYNTAVADPRPELRKLSPETLKSGASSFDAMRKEVNQLIELAAAVGDFDAVSEKQGAKKDVSSSAGSAAGSPAASVKDVCVYALQGGKRLRSIIVLEIARGLNALHAMPTPIDCAEVALGVEYLHAASLVVDDMPYFDNDAERRGRASTHTRFGPAAAQMGALTLLFTGLEEISRQVEWIRRNAPHFPNPDRVGTIAGGEVARAVRTAAGGQLDEPNAPVESTAYRKTATFYELSFVLPYLFASADFNPDRVAEIRRAGADFGVAFQVADDLTDTESDRARNIPNFANTYGAEAARREVAQRLNSCALTLQRYNLWSPLWEEICGMVQKQ
jgi:geranylgeranyl pyrophosphate synthase